MHRGDRLAQIEQLLLAHPEGFLRVDIARRLGVHRSTVTRDIAELSVARPIVEDNDRRVRLDRAGYVTLIHLTMFELEALHLSARTRGDEPLDGENPPTVATCSPHTRG